jgi:HrpA-like RNA helicase
MPRKSKFISLDNFEQKSAETKAIAIKEALEKKEQQRMLDLAKATSMFPDKSIQSRDHISKLKIREQLPQIWENMLSGKKVVIVNAGTGSGKSVGIPQVSLEYLHKFENEKKLLVSVPTVLTAQMMTQYAHDMMPDHSSHFSCVTGREKIGDWKSSKVVYGTTRSIFNILVELFKTNNLDNIIVMIDEAHHTSSENYIIQGMCNWLLQKGYSIQVIVATATPSSHAFENLLSDTVFTVNTNPFPIKTHFTVSNVLSISGNYEQKEYDDNFFSLCCEAISEQTGDGLIFVPGKQEAQDLADKLLSSFLEIKFYPISSDSTPEELFEAVQDTPGVRKVIIATNIAETGVTINNLKFVVDGLLHKVKKTERKGGIDFSIISTEVVSRASALQRKGRVGRTCHGDYYAFCTKDFFDNLNKHNENEFYRMQKHTFVLEFLANKLDCKEILKLSCFEYDRVIQDLKDLGLISQDMIPTPTGIIVSKFPVSLNNAVIMANVCKNFSSIDKMEMIFITMAVSIIETKASVQNIVFFPKDVKGPEKKEYVMDDDVIGEHDDDITPLVAKLAEFNTFPKKGMNCFSKFLMKEVFCKNKYEWCRAKSMNHKFFKTSEELFFKLISRISSIDEKTKITFGDLFDFKCLMDQSGISATNYQIRQMFLTGYSRYIYDKEYSKTAKFVYTQIIDGQFMEFNPDFSSCIPKHRLPSRVIAFGCCEIKTPKGFHKLISLLVPI